MGTRCPSCASLETKPVRDDRLNWHCDVCGAMWKLLAPSEDDSSNVNLNDRIAVLQASRAALESRLLACSIPSAMIAQAESLERQAEEIFDRAQRIRATLASDTAMLPALLVEAEDIDLEIIACRSCQQCRIPVTRGMLRNVVEMFRNQRC